METDPAFVPDFFVVGAPKAGTTAVFNWLQGHPDVFLPAIKEPSYFACANGTAVAPNGPYDPEYHAGLTADGSDYAQLYAAAGNRLAGDVSPVYLVDQSVAKRISRLRPDAKIIIILRDPVERAFSQFLHHVRDGLEPCTCFETALDLESARLRDGWSWGHAYATHGHYAEQIDRYLVAFPRDQVLFLEFSHLNIAPDDCWGRICAFLGVQPLPLTRNERVNVTSGLATISDRPAILRAMRHPGRIQRLLKPLAPPVLRKRIRRLLEGTGKPLPVLQDSTRKLLAARFSTERSQIADQTGLSLEHWTQAG